MFGSGLRRVSGRGYDGECSGGARDTCESFELSIVRIGLETTELRVKGLAEPSFVLFTSTRPDSASLSRSF